MTLEQIFKEKYEHREDPNPNWKYRPNGVDGIIIHSMGQFIGTTHATDFLVDAGLSAHKLIEPNGNVWECVDPKHQAYHAGVSRFNGDDNLNTSFVGIEILIEGNFNYATFLEAIKKPESFTQQHMDSCAVECALLMDQYDIPSHRIVKHSDVSGDDVRGLGKGKKDVGDGFPWQHFKTLTVEFLHQLRESRK